MVGRRCRDGAACREPALGQLLASSARRAALPSHQHPLGSVGAPPGAEAWASSQLICSYSGCSQWVLCAFYFLFFEDGTVSAG